MLNRQPAFKCFDIKKAFDVIYIEDVFCYKPPTGEKLNWTVHCPKKSLRFRNIYILFLGSEGFNL